jgi:hypothetical protein
MPRNGSRILRALAGADDNVTARAKAVAASNVFISILLRFAFGMNAERPRRNAEVGVHAWTLWQVLSIKA